MKNAPAQSIDLEQLIASPRLPTLPTVALQIIELVQQPDVGIDELAEAISRDPALSTKVLKSANSGFYSRSRSVTRLKDALMVLGLRTVKTLSLSFSLVGPLRANEGGGFDYIAFWQRSLLTASCARSLVARLDKTQKEEAFLAGLVHCLGVVALHQGLAAQYESLFTASKGVYRRLREAEREALGLDHTHVGAAMAEKWNLPAGITAVLRYYPEPQKASPAEQLLVRAVAAAAVGADVLVSGGDGEALRLFYDRCEDWFGLSPSDAQEILAASHADAQVMGGLMEMKDDARLNVGDILSRANEAMMSINLEVTREAEQLEARNEQLETQASTDGLTGLANRRRLDEFLEEQCKIAKRHDKPMGVLMIDLDHFKRFNDTYGHQTGDLVLATVAEAIQATVRKADLVARYGGEEMVVIMPETRLAGAAQLANRVRSAIEALEVIGPSNETLKVTASIGVASLNTDQQTTPAQLIAAADKALYEAKAAGRNRVRLAA